MNILVFNRGSSTLKAYLFALPDGGGMPAEQLPPRWKCLVDWTGTADRAEITINTIDGREIEEVYSSPDRNHVVTHALASIWSGPARMLEGPGEIALGAHRIVHGGADYRQAVFVDSAVEEAIDRLSAFAPVHNPASLEGIRLLRRIFGASFVQTAVFDTAFHTALPLPAAVYPLPYRFFEQGIRRYGFHGISVAYCVDRAAQMLKRPDLRLVVCHLGNGCSVTAAAGGKCMDTTMGFTPLEGIMMGSRSGSVDPGVLIYALRAEGCDANRLEHMLNCDSGLLGVSGVSSDLRKVQQAADAGSGRAQLAIAVFVHRLRLAIGSMAAVLGGIDALVFTAGIGEHSALIRAEACRPFGFLGLNVDPGLNSSEPEDVDISSPGSPVRVLVIKTKEEWQIARESWQLVQQRRCLN